MSKNSNGSFANFPFANGEFAKMWEDFKVPGFDVEALAATQRKNLEVVTAANQSAVEGFQAVAKRQAEMFQDSLAAFQKASQELMTTSDVSERAAKQAELTKAGWDKAFANATELSELVSKSTTETFDIFRKRFEESVEEVRSAMTAR